MYNPCSLFRVNLPRAEQTCLHIEDLLQQEPNAGNNASLTEACDDTEKHLSEQIARTNAVRKLIGFEALTPLETERSRQLSQDLRAGLQQFLGDPSGGHSVEVVARCQRLREFSANLNDGIQDAVENFIAIKQLQLCQVDSKSSQAVFDGVAPCLQGIVQLVLLISNNLTPDANKHVEFFINKLRGIILDIQTTNSTTPLTSKMEQHTRSAIHIIIKLCSWDDLLAWVPFVVARLKSFTSILRDPKDDAAALNQALFGFNGWTRFLNILCGCFEDSRRFHALHTIVLKLRLWSRQFAYPREAPPETTLKVLTDISGALVNALDTLLLPDGPDFFEQLLRLVKDVCEVQDMLKPDAIPPPDKLVLANTACRVSVRISHLRPTLQYLAQQLNQEDCVNVVMAQSNEFTGMVLSWTLQRDSGDTSKCKAKADALYDTIISTVAAASHTSPETAVPYFMRTIYEELHVFLMRTNNGDATLSRIKFRDAMRCRMLFLPVAISRLPSSLSWGASVDFQKIGVVGKQLYDLAVDIPEDATKTNEFTEKTTEFTMELINIIRFLKVGEEPRLAMELLEQFENIFRTKVPLEPIDIEAGSQRIFRLATEHTFLTSSLAARITHTQRKQEMNDAIENFREMFGAFTDAVSEYLDKRVTYDKLRLAALDFQDSWKGHTKEVESVKNSCQWFDRFTIQMESISDLEHYLPFNDAKIEELHKIIPKRVCFTYDEAYANCKVETAPRTAPTEPRTSRRQREDVVIHRQVAEFLVSWALSEEDYGICAYCPTALLRDSRISPETQQRIISNAEKVIPNVKFESTSREDNFCQLHRFKKYPGTQ